MALKVNWRQLLTTIKGIGQAFLPSVVSDLVDTIEDQVTDLVSEGKKGWSGPEKHAKVLETFLNSLLVYEGLKNEDVFNNEVIRTSGSKLINAVHAQKEATAEIISEIKRLKAEGKTPPAVDPTGPVS